MTFVVDASLAGAWCMPDEDDEPVLVLLRRLQGETALAPMLWWYEVRNMLLVNERRGRLGAAQRAAFLADLERLPILLDHEPKSEDVMSLAGRHRLTAYDAAYLELAARKGVPLATLDRRLADAARAEGIARLPA